MEDEYRQHLKSKRTTYDVDVECINCGASHYSIDVPMGKELQCFLNKSGYKCPYCGCIGTMTKC
jgi:DNA-directed RNA polymerase subunit RPC12/RpoP